MKAAIDVGVRNCPRRDFVSASISADTAKRNLSSKANTINSTVLMHDSTTKIISR